MLHLQAAAERLTVSRPGGSILAVHNGRGDQRPYLHPLLAPDLLGSVTEDAPAHHPWQHGLYMGLNDVNGVGFWTEGLFPKYRAIDGSVITTALTPAAASGPATSGAGASASSCSSGGFPEAAWHAAAAWLDRQGQPILTDRQLWQMEDAGARYWLNLTWTITAVVAVHFGKYAYGGLFLRMPFSSEAQGLLLTSEGVSAQEQAEGQRARWVATAMILPERRGLNGDARYACVTLMDHPANPEHPTPWRVDGQLGVGPSRCAAGAWSLSAGESATFRHRVLVSLGPPRREEIEESYQAFAETLS